jgi:hypothetical protein
LFWLQALPIEYTAELAVAVGKPTDQTKRDNRPDGGKGEKERHHYGFLASGAPTDRRTLIQSFSVEKI